MSEESETTLVAKLYFELASISANTRVQLEKIEQLEKRVTKVEDTLSSGKTGTFKDELMMLLAKGLVGAVLVIGSLTGAGALLKSIFS